MKWHRSSKYYWKNRKEILKKQRISYEKNKDQFKKYREEHKEREYERHAEWRRKNLKYCAKFLKEWRHRKGISKSYNPPDSGIKSSKKQRNQMYRRRVRKGGKLLIETIQKLYEDNIKQFGTLTCYLCLQPIRFGNDSLEHKTPLSRGGTNNYENLAIACRICNSKKHTQTEKEYRKEVSLQ